MSVIDELLQNACPSIRYRIRSEIIGEPETTLEMVRLQKEILSDEWVKKVFSWQQADGWIGRDFHGENSMETGIRVLCEKGLNTSHPVLKQALSTLLKEKTRMIRGIGKVGDILDDHNLGGTKMIQATVFAYAGVEEPEIVKDQIQKALQAFKAIGTIHSVEEITTIYQKKLVFQPDIVWPSIYHLRLLVFTQSWRTPGNIKVLANAIQRIIQLSPIPEILVRSKSQLVAPASFCMLDFNPDMRTMSDSRRMMWFHRMELLARLGIIHLVPELQDQIARVKFLLAENQERFDLKVNHYYFRKWSPYCGLMLEKDWKKHNRRIYDLTFRCLLIFHYHQKNLVFSNDQSIKSIQKTTQKVSFKSNE
jgi:hypothetical protein